MVSLKLQSYFKRINYSGDTSVSLKTLNEITLAHAMSIPFENIDVVLDRGIKLSDEAIFSKLVINGRGGYCFEQNALLLNMLLALGFNAKPISGRVRLRFPTREEIGPRTHVFVKVDHDEKTYLTDVGMGSGSLTMALILAPEFEQKTPHDVRRFEKVGTTWYHQIRHADIWIDACEFTLEEMPLIDREVANWFTSKHPDSHFRDRIVASRALKNGERISLQNSEFTLRLKNGEAKKKRLSSMDEVIDVLKNEFGIVLNSTDCELLLTKRFEGLGL